MPQDIGRIPIITFAGCKPLTDVFRELPIPQSTHVSIGCRTLLYGPELMQDSKRLLDENEPKLVQLLSDAIRAVKTDDIIYTNTGDIQSTTVNLPSLLKVLIDGGVFSDRIASPSISTSQLPASGSVVETFRNNTSNETKKDSYSAVYIAPLRISLKKAVLPGTEKSVDKAPKRKVKVELEKVSAQSPLAKSHSLPNVAPCSTEILDMNQHTVTNSTASLNISEHSEGECTQETQPLCQAISTTAASDINSTKTLSDHVAKTSDNSNLKSPPDPSRNLDSQQQCIPDPTLPHLFQSAALFHAFRVNNELEKSGVDCGGGLFDDWVDHSHKTDTLDENDNPPKSEYTYSGSLSGPSSVICNPLSISQAPNSIDPATESNNVYSRSPHSVLSNHSSYPTTPGGNFTTVPNCPTVNSPQHKMGAKLSLQSSPAAQLFGSSDVQNDLGDISLEEKSRVAEHGLAAYLPRSSSLKLHVPNDGYSSGQDVDAMRHSPSDIYPVRSSTETELSSKPFSTGKSGEKNKHYSGRHFDEFTSTKSKNRIKYMCAKPKGGGRRRRTELEELQRWNVNDRSSIGSEKKENDLGISPSRFDSRDRDVIAANSDDCTTISQSSTPGKQREIPMSNTATHGPFTEALVERVKRRRQQRESENCGRAVKSDLSTDALMDFSPNSIPSPFSSRIVDSMDHRSRSTESPNGATPNNSHWNSDTFSSKSNRSLDRIRTHKSCINSNDYECNSFRDLFPDIGCNSSSLTGSNRRQRQASPLPLHSDRVLANGKSPPTPKLPTLLPLNNSIDGKLFTNDASQNSVSDIGSLKSKPVSEMNSICRPRSPSRSPPEDQQDFRPNLSMDGKEHLRDTVSVSPIESYTCDNNCPTPSTIPYTDSSAMEDVDVRVDLPLSCDSRSDQRPKHLCSDSDELSDTSNNSEAPPVITKSDSPSPISSSCEGNELCNEIDEDNARAEELAVTAAALTHFSSRLGKLLRRVEELDLLKLAGDASSIECSGNADDGHSVPDVVRLSRHELNSLYVYSAQLHLGGSMYSIPTGRLVRFLTLLLVNIQAGARRMLTSLSDDEVNEFLKHRGRRRDDVNTEADQNPESFLWANRDWSAFLVGLDAARIALNIIVAPDMPRPLLMEDVLDGIVSIVKNALDNVICKYSAPVPSTSRHSARYFCSFALDCVGFRVAQLMASLNNLVRFQANRFTDNLVLRFTSLALCIPLYCMRTGFSIYRDHKRLSSQLIKRLVEPSSHTSEAIFRLTLRPTRLCLLTWPGLLQRACLSLLSALYNQYETHRKLILEEIFTNLTGLGSESSGESSDNRTARTFRVLSSCWLYTLDKQLRTSFNADRRHEPANSEQQAFVHIHALTALLLSLTQGLVQIPVGTSSAGTSNCNTTRKLSTSSGEQIPEELSQFQKDENHVILSYNASLRHAHYLVSGLLKTVCSKTESSLRPLLDTLTTDLLAISAAAPIEWPVAMTLLGVFGAIVVQHLSSNGSHSNSDSCKNADASSKLVHMDILTTLLLGLKQLIQESQTDSPMSNTDEALQQARLISYLSSNLHVVNYWLWEPGVISNPLALNFDLNLSRECSTRIRLDHTDTLHSCAQRFFLASWLYEYAREMNLEKKDSEQLGSKTGTKHSRDREHARRQLMSELAITHHSLSACFPWILTSKHSSSIVGSSSLSSPLHNNRNNRNIHGGNQTTHSACSGSTPNRSIALGGSIIASSAPAIRYVNYAHMTHLSGRFRVRLAAQAHWSAKRLLALHPITPGFGKLFALLCRLVSETAVPVRTKALRSISSVLERDSLLFNCNRSSKPNAKHSDGSSAAVRDLPRLVHARLLDHSTAVREAAVDLISRLLVLRPRLLTEYYGMLSERILDKGVSVRKRVIRCFRELLAVDWTQSRSSGSHYKDTLLVRNCGAELCGKLIRRLHDDEESIQKVVTDLFQNLWFTAIPETNERFSKLLDRRIKNFSAVTSSLRSGGNLDHLESSIKQLLNTNDVSKAADMDLACEQMINRILLLIKRHTQPLFSPGSPVQPNRRPSGQQSSTVFLPPSTLNFLLASLHLIGRCKPKLLVVHCKFLIDLLHHCPQLTRINSTQPVSTTSIDPNMSQLDTQSLFHLISVIEIALAKLASDDVDFSDDNLVYGISRAHLETLQKDVIQLMQRQGRIVVDSSLSCLSVLATDVLKNHIQVALIFEQFYGLLINLSPELRRVLTTSATSMATPLSSRSRPSVLRALYIVGLMCKHFQLNHLVNEKKCTSTRAPALDEILDTLMLFAEFGAIPDKQSVDCASMSDSDLCRKAIMGISFMVCHYDQLLCAKRLRAFYSRFFIDIPPMVKSSTFQEVQCIVVDNLTRYLIDSEKKMVLQSQSWSSTHKNESLKELADRHSGHSSAVAQTYLPIILQHCILTGNNVLRTAALSFISVVIRQGLVHPVQMIPSLISLQTDFEASNRSRASHALAETERKIPGFITMHAVQGIRMSYCLQMLLHVASLDPSHSLAHVPIIRGANTNVSLNHQLYTLLRSHRQNRRSFISNMLSPFSSEQLSELNIPQLTTALCKLSNVEAQLSLGHLIFIGDQLAHFPYLVHDEVLYLAYSLDRQLGDRGSCLMRLVQETLLSSLINSNAMTVEKAQSHLLNLLDNAESRLTTNQSHKNGVDVWDHGNHLKRLLNEACPADSREHVRRAMLHSGSVCFIMLSLKRHLRDVYGVTDSKLKDYSPSDPPKQWDRPVQPTGKQSDSPTDLITLPSFVDLCMRNPDWFSSIGATGPSDAILLEHFIRLRQQLLSLDAVVSPGYRNEETGVSSQCAAHVERRLGETNAITENGPRTEVPSEVDGKSMNVVESSSSSVSRPCSVGKINPPVKSENSSSAYRSRAGRQQKRSTVKRVAHQTSSSEDLSSLTSSSDSSPTRHRSIKTKRKLKSVHSSKYDRNSKSHTPSGNNASSSFRRQLSSSSDSNAGSAQREFRKSEPKIQENRSASSQRGIKVEAQSKQTCRSNSHISEESRAASKSSLKVAHAKQTPSKTKSLNAPVVPPNPTVAVKKSVHSMRSLAPLPDAMMRSSHAFSKRKLKPQNGRSKPSQSTSKERVGGNDRGVLDCKSTNQSASASVHRPDSTRPKKPNRIHRLSDSSSLSSESSAIGTKTKRTSGRCASLSSATSSTSSSDCSLSSSSSSYSPVTNKKSRTACG